MAQTFDNKNHKKISTKNFGKKQHPLSSVEQNSKLKGKAKADALRLRDRQQREQLLAQHRLMQQKNVKLQHERENAHQIPGISGHENPNQHFEDNKHGKALPKVHVVANSPLHRGHDQPGHAAEAHEAHLSTSPADQSHETPGHDGAIGDWSSRNGKCKNCCGRPQIPGPEETQHLLNRCSEKVESSEDCGFGSEFACANRSRVVVSRRGCADRCTLEPRIHDHHWDKSLLEIGGNQTLENPVSQLKGGSGKGGVGVSAKPDLRTATELKPSCLADNTDLSDQSHRNQLAGENTSMVYSDVTDALDELETELTLPISNDETEMRLRGGCGGGCGGGTQNSARCPCGGCGGAACGTCNTCCGTKPPLGCCGGNQTRGLPCRCRCKSCSDPRPPCGSCGGQNCGKWNSCAGSGGGRCCFPRNTRRRNGPDCCGGGSGGCGGGCC